MQERDEREDNLNSVKERILKEHEQLATQPRHATHESLDQSVVTQEQKQLKR